MSEGANMTTLEIDYECRDRIVIASLKETIEILREENEPGDKKLIAAARALIKYYGGND